MARKYSSISVATTLNGTISSSTTTIQVAAGTAALLLGGVTLGAGNVDQFAIAIDPDTASEEVCFITAVSGDIFTIVRGQASSTAITHTTGATIQHVLTGEDLDYYYQTRVLADGAIQKSTVTTKGDILVATGSATLVRQGVGSNGTVLTADSTQADGVIWSAIDFSSGSQQGQIPLVMGAF
jgi:hypothetical protein